MLSENKTVVWKGGLFSFLLFGLVRFGQPTRRKLIQYPIQNFDLIFSMRTYLLQYDEFVRCEKRFLNMKDFCSESVLNSVALLRNL